MQTYAPSTEGLLLLLRREKADIHRISPKGYTLSNGLDYCSVGLKSKDGTDYSVQAYGKEVIELHHQANKSGK